MTSFDVIGIPASLGTATGEVRYFNENNPLERFECDVILVTDYLPPSVASLDTRVKGLVVEESSILCHAASIARELRIPCICGVEDATKVLAKGCPIRIHGASGVIEYV